MQSLRACVLCVGNPRFQSARSERLPTVPTKSCGRCSPRAFPSPTARVVKLPEPTLADGMTAAAQRQQIEAIAEGRNSWEDLTRRAVVAPFILKTSQDASEQRGVGRRVDLWFVAYGSLDTLASDDFLSNQFKTASDDSENASSARLLGRCGPEEDAACPSRRQPDDPRYVAAETTLLERVRVSATTRSIKTRTAESLVVASILDPRFADDPEFPNRWRSILRDDAGNRQFGAAARLQRAWLLRQGHAPCGTAGGDLDRISRRLRGTASVVQRRKSAAIQAADPRPDRRPQAAAKPGDAVNGYRPRSASTGCSAVTRRAGQAAPRAAMRNASSVPSTMAEIGQSPWTNPDVARK